MKNKNKLLLYLLSFILPILIITTHIISMEIIKGNYIQHGENFLMADMSSQYNSIYAYIWDVLRGNDSIFYSFGKGLGGNMASTVGYYASSPLNLMYLFVKKVDIPLMTFIIYLIKIGLSSLFMNIFLNKKLEYRKGNIIFSIMYALMAYNVNYYFNNMWLDVILLTPLVILGIDKLINDKSILLYTSTLSLAIISNFYIAYMLCLFCVIYFVYQLYNKYRLKEFKKYKGILLIFIIGSLLAGGISMIFLLPEVLNLKEIMRFTIDKSKLNIDFGMIPKQIINNLFSKLYIGSHNTSSVLSRVRPNLYSGMLTIVLVYFYFFNKKIKLKEKLMSGCVIIFFVISFMMPHLNLLWQAGSFPNGYICRYSFAFSFFIIFLACRCFIRLDKVKFRYFLIFIILYGLLSIRIGFQYLEFLEISDIIISSIFILIYLVTLWLIMYTKIKKRVLKIILLLMVIIELFINFKLCFIVNDDINISGSYREYYKEVCPNLKKLKSDTGFYRVDGDYRYSYLDSWICNNHTITTSLSTNNGNLYRFYKQNGGSVTYTTIMYDMNKLPIFDSIFGVKYIKAPTKLKGTIYSLYDKIPISKKKNLYIYENPYSLSLGFTIPANYLSIYNNIKVNDSVDALNRTMKTLSGNEEDVLIKYDKEFLGNGKYKFNINNDVEYIYMSFDYETSINWTVYNSIYINGKYITSSHSQDVGSMKVKNKYANSSINVRVGEEEYPDLKNDLVIYYIDMDVFKKDIELMKKNQLTNIKIDGNKMTGLVDVAKDSVLYTSIPYEEGWQVFVDGKKVNYEKVLDEFIGIKLTKGRHDIKMVYYPHHIKIGAFITLLSVAILILYEKSVRKLVN